MTHYWTKRRKWSLGIHVAFVLVPFTLSTVSALLFWRAMFGGWWLAVPMVAVIEVLSLAGLVLIPDEDRIAVRRAASLATVHIHRAAREGVVFTLGAQHADCRMVIDGGFHACACGHRLAML
jgi:hypothetical protein